MDGEVGLEPHLIYFIVQQEFPRLIELNIMQSYSFIESIHVLNLKGPASQLPQNRPI